MQLKSRWAVLGAASSLGWLCGCSDLPAERALRDTEVGHVAVAGVTFSVAEGLATVQDARDGTLALWLNAPAIELTAIASAEASRSWTIELRNAMPDATLTVVAGDGAVTPPTALASSVDTVRTFRIELTPGGYQTLHFGPERATEVAPFRFAALGDISGGPEPFGSVLTGIAAEPDVEFILCVGDITQGGTAEEIQSAQSLLQSVPLPMYSAIGNHDAPADTPWHDLVGRANQSFAYRGARFTFVDSADATVAGRVYGWLDEWLRRGSDVAHVLVSHIAPVDPVGLRAGSFASRDEAGGFLSSLARGGVDLTLYGHIHSFYSFENAGIPAYISGGAAGHGEGLDDIGPHFLLIDLDPVNGNPEVRRIDVDEP
jgi:predicted phosphodiesterase